MPKDTQTDLKHIMRVAGILQGKWTLQILCAMRTAPVRLSQLSRAIPSASKKGLTASLKSLQREGIVVRRDLSDVVLHVEYDFAEQMRAPVAELLSQLAAWADLHLASAPSSTHPGVTKKTGGVLAETFPAHTHVRRHGGDVDR